MAIVRKQTKEVWCGDVKIGGNAPISIQSMTNSDTRNIKETLFQIKNLQEAGCDTVRVAIPDQEAAQAVKELKKASKIPIVADIHFDYRLAIQCIENGIDKLRLNPGNIGASDRVKEVVKKAKERRIPIRIGVNAGSLEKNIIAKYGHITSEALVESAINHINILEELNFEDIVVSLKASDIQLSLEAYRLMSQKVQDRKSVV